jgi:hypothetical protein
MLMGQNSLQSTAGSFLRSMQLIHNKQNGFRYLYRWVPCHHGMARAQVADGGNGLQIWSVAANILNKQSRTADKGWSSSLSVGRGANNRGLFRDLHEAVCEQNTVIVMLTKCGTYSNHCAFMGRRKQ